VVASTLEMNVVNMEMNDIVEMLNKILLVISSCRCHV
jgi:hypothetical protein